MLVSRLSLRNFRSYERAEVRLAPGMTVVAGRNGAIVPLDAPAGMATVGAGGTPRVYALSAGELARIGRARLTRGFTRAECVQFLHVATCPRSAPSPSIRP